MAEVLETRVALVSPEKVGSNVCARCARLFRRSWRRRSDLVVVANVYEGRRWNRVEAFHQECYREAGCPYGASREGRGDG